MELKLNTQFFKKLNIDGHEFNVDVKDTDKIEALENWISEQSKISKFSKGALKDCPELIDKILGNGAFNMLFSGHENSAAQYELCYTLNQIFQAEFLKDQIEKREAEEKANFEKIEKVCESLDKFNKAIDYADRKYGGKNVVAGKKRPSNKFRR